MKSTRQEESVKADSVSMGDRTSELECNGLLYRIPQPLSSAISRSYKREYSQKNVYTSNQVIVFDLNVGTNYFDPSTAMLSFKFNITKTPELAGGPVVYKFDGSLGGAALFSEIRILGKSGTELSRTQDANVLSKIIVDYTTTTDKRKELQMANGYTTDVTPVVPLSGFVITPFIESTVVAGGTSFTNDLQILIPLKYLSGFFRPVSTGMLVPSTIGSGLRIELSLVASAANAMNTATATGTAIPTQFTVTDPTILLECSELDSITQAALQNESAANGLQYTYPEYYSTKLSVPANGSVATQVNKAVSQATRLFFIPQPVVATLAGEMIVDSLAAGPSSMIKSYQFRVGSMYFPNLLVDNNIEKFGYAVSAMASMSDSDLGTGVTFYDYNYGAKCIIAASLETNSRLNLAGLLLNNSSTAELRLTNGFTTAGGDLVATAIKGVLFVEYIAVCQSSLNRSQLRI